MEIRSAFSSRKRVSIRIEGDTRTKQSMAEACDINRIMGRYIRGGTVDHLARFGGQYGAVDAITFHDAMNIVARTEQMFAALPSGLRKRFSNSPGEFLKFVQDEKNIDECRKLGLAKPAAIAAASSSPPVAGVPGVGPGGAAPLPSGAPGAPGTVST